MAEQESKPKTKEADHSPEDAHSWLKVSSLASARWLLPLALGIMLLLAGCGRGNETAEASQQGSETPAITQTSDNTRSAESNAALTRVASSLAQTQDTLPTVTPTPAVADSALVPLPTLTPTIIPSPVATRTIEIGGEATLRLQLNNETFESSGQPVTIALEPRTYVLGGDVMTQSDQWCAQLGPTGLIFDLTFTLRYVTEDLHVGGELQLYDGFCGEWGGLGNQLSTLPMDITVPAGSSAQIAPTMQVQGAFFGIPNVLDINTGVSLELTIRNPSPR
jgi:hypothetical protein